MITDWTLYQLSKSIHHPFFDPPPRGVVSPADAGSGGAAGRPAAGANGIGATQEEA